MAAKAAARKRPPARHSTSRADHAVSFIETFCRHTKGRWAGQPMRLEPWQRDDIIRPLFGDTTRLGLRRYTEALIGIPRKNGKSTLAAAIALYLLIADGEPGAEVYSAAGDKDQARIVFGQARAMVNASPHLRSWCRVFRDVIEVPETDSLYRVLSSDAPLKHGLNVHAAVIDELHIHKDPELYYALQSASGTRREPLLVSITTAGFDRRSLCFDRYTYGQKGRDPRFFFRWWGAAEDAKPTDSKTLRAANPASFITLDYLRQQARRLPDNVNRRLHLNQWVQQEDRWLPMDLWDNCGDPPQIPDDAEVFVAVDAAPKRDTTAVACCWVDDTGAIHTEVEIFRADASGILDYNAVKDHIRELATRRVIVELIYDPYHFTQAARELDEEGIPTQEFPQTDARMVPASSALFDAVVEGRLRHGGDPRVREQADAAAAKQTSRGWRLHKLKATRPIDAMVALAMAIDAIERGDGPVSPIGIIVGPDRR